jgi:hypothetical protein
MMKGRAFSLMNVNKVNILKKTTVYFFSVLCVNLDDIGEFLFYLHQNVIPRNESGNACRSSNLYKRLRRSRLCMFIEN